MCSVGSGMVLAMGDLAGATFITLLAAPATQFARAVAYGRYARSRSSCRAAGLVGNGLAIDDPPSRRSCPASDRPPREQGTRGRSSGAGRRTVARTGWWDVLAGAGK